MEELEKLEWVPVEDDGTRWVLPPAIEGGPFAVLACDRDGSPVEISEDEVCCPKCGKRTPPMASASLLDVLAKWNEMVDHGEGHEVR
jgi:hypothetical protein